MKMLQFILLLSFLAAVPSTMQGAVLSKEKIIIKSQGSWCGKGEKSLQPTLPIEAYFINNNFIEIYSLTSTGYPFTIQLVDANGNLIDEYGFCLIGDGIYKIDVNDISAGRYSIVYEDDFIKAFGEFEKK